jgi:hypothetical protein
MTRFLTLSLVAWALTGVCDLSVASGPGGSTLDGQPATPVAPKPKPRSGIRIAPADPEAPDTSSRSYMLGRLIYTQVDVEFDQTPLRDALDEIGQALGIVIVGRFRSDSEPDGLDADLPITLNLERKTALDVMKLVLEIGCSDQDCTWQLRDGFVEVGPKSRLSVPAARVTRAYPVQDLLYVPPKFTGAPNLNLAQPTGQWWQEDFGAYNQYFPSLQPIGTGSVQPDPNDVAAQLLHTITNSIEPTAWDVNGGTIARISITTGGELVVSAPDYIQRAVGGYPVPPRPRPTEAAKPPSTQPSPQAEDEHLRSPTRPMPAPPAGGNSPARGTS